MASIAQPWLISKFVDPIFAVFIGLSAATLRIRREQLEKYPNENATPLALWQKGVRMGTSYYRRGMGK
ncbi:hypothetical protein LTR84_010173 [Exophiala bonariae]|uniref:NADH dehydrogenase [ubiquinone] 1 alpha subcomplex subunit 1 n=1 Tax=Exophiala bonariae TaxID=1690606 RepID=A0AAV9MXE5_9EURO|nr:hypothetical protein LTR84_010173 [Exophiala bonariae]